MIPYPDVVGNLKILFVHCVEGQTTSEHVVKCISKTARLGCSARQVADCNHSTTAVGRLNQLQEGEFLE